MASVHQTPITQSTSRLWEISSEILILESKIDEIQDSDLTDDQKELLIESAFQTWLETSTKFEEKATTVARYIQHQESLAEARKQEYKRLRALSEQAQTQANRLRSYLLKEMHKAGKTRIEGTAAKISLRRKPPRVCLNCEIEELPQAFKRVDVTPRLSEIKKAIKDNPDLDWAFLCDSNEYSLIIR